MTSRERRERIEELEIGDPFEFFGEQARRLRRELAIPIDFLEETIAIVRGAFGDEWIRKQVATTKHASPIPFHSHPLGSHFGTGGGSAVVSVFELAVYLKCLAAVPNLPLVIENMKENWDAGLLQIAYTYRFLKAGATDLELEPDAAGGRRADIFFRLETIPYLVECYIPQVRHRDTTEELRYSFNRIAEAVAGSPTQISIRLRRSIDAKDRKRIESKIIKAVEGRGKEPLTDIEDVSATIRIENVMSQEIEHDIPNPAADAGAYGDADWGVKTSSVPCSSVAEIRYREVPSQAVCSLLVWQAQNEKRSIPFEERIEELKKKIKKKLAQTRRKDEPRRIVVVTLPEATRADEETRRLCMEQSRSVC